MLIRLMTKQYVFFYTLLKKLKIIVYGQITT